MHFRSKSTKILKAGFLIDAEGSENANLPVSRQFEFTGSITFAMFLAILPIAAMNRLCWTQLQTCELCCGR